MTSTIYNQAFHDMIRGKKRIDPVALNEGYDSGCTPFRKRCRWQLYLET